MCLAKVFTDSEMAEWLEDQPEVIEVWKVASLYHFTDVAFYPPCEICNLKPYRNGYQQAKQELIQNKGKKYWSGFHFLINFSDAETYKECCPIKTYDVAIRCFIKKQWVTSLGESEQLFGDKKVFTIVASQAVFPHYPETEARLEDLPKEITHHSSEAQGAGAKQAPNFAL